MSAAACLSISRAAAPPCRTYWCDMRMPRLPPVDISPHTRLRATFWPGVGYSVVTFDQSHSSSSATSWASPVSVPWPISERAMRMTTVSSGRITTQALISGEPSCARMTCGPPKGMSRPSANPPPKEAALTTKLRRSICATLFMAASSSRVRGSGVDRRAYLLVGAAAADIRDVGIDVGIGRFRLVLEERRHRHDHPGLAIAALRHVVVEPGLLHLVQHAVLRQSLDRGDLPAGDRAQWHRARAHRHTIDMDGAGAALGDATAVLGAGQAHSIPQHPQERGGGIDIDLMCLSIDGEISHLQISMHRRREEAMAIAAFDPPATPRTPLGGP